MANLNAVLRENEEAFYRYYGRYGKVYEIQSSENAQPIKQGFYYISGEGERDNDKTRKKHRAHAGTLVPMFSATEKTDKNGSHYREIVKYASILDAKKIIRTTALPWHYNLFRYILQNITHTVTTPISDDILNPTLVDIFDFITSFFSTPTELWISLQEPVSVTHLFQRNFWLLNELTVKVSKIIHFYITRRSVIPDDEFFIHEHRLINYNEGMELNSICYPILTMITEDGTKTEKYKENINFYRDILRNINSKERSFESGKRQVTFKLTKHINEKEHPNRIEEIPLNIDLNNNSTAFSFHKRNVLFNGINGKREESNRKNMNGGRAESTRKRKKNASPNPVRKTAKSRKRRHLTNTSFSKNKTKKN